MHEVYARYAWNSIVAVLLPLVVAAHLISILIVEAVSRTGCIAALPTNHVSVLAAKLYCSSRNAELHCSSRNAELHCSSCIVVLF